MLLDYNVTPPPPRGYHRNLKIIKCLVKRTSFDTIDLQVNNFWGRVKIYLLESVGLL